MTDEERRNSCGRIATREDFEFESCIIEGDRFVQTGRVVLVPDYELFGLDFELVCFSHEIIDLDS